MDADKVKALGAQLLNSLAAELLQRVESGEATASELNVARQFLKDNGIEAISENSQVLSLADVVPFKDDGESPVTYSSVDG